MLRREVLTLPSYKNLRQARPAHQNILSTAGTDAKASDLNLIYSIGKLFDPGSVVREGAAARVRLDAGVLQGPLPNDALRIVATGDKEDPPPASLQEACLL